MPLLVKFNPFETTQLFKIPGAVKVSPFKYVSKLLYPVVEVYKFKSAADEAFNPLCVSQISGIPSWSVSNGVNPEGKKGHAFNVVA